jgi:uncharacterized protein (TIGR03083 family)
MLTGMPEAALPERRGLSDVAPADLAAPVLAAWDAFLDVVTAPSTDLERPSRLPGWSGKDTCVHLGSWPDSLVLDDLLDAARAGEAGVARHPDQTNATLVDAHRDATPSEVVDALLAGRERVAAFFASPEAVELARQPSRSAVGPMPVLSLVHAGAYELAVHALDLGPCGAPAPAPELLHRGLAALVDVTGGLAARAGVDLTLTAQTPEGGWRFTSGTAGWTTEPVPPGRFTGTGVSGRPADLLDTSAGRHSPAQLILTRRMHVQEMHHWMRLAPLLEQVPGLPGGATLRTAAHGLHGVSAGVGRLLSHLPGLRR